MTLPPARIADDGKTQEDAASFNDTSAIGDWADLAFFDNDWPGIRAQIATEQRQILPPPPQRFAALTLTQAAQTRVVILGQDPYPTPGHANGLAFSTLPDVTPLPRSLSNIFKELQGDIGACPSTGDLQGWARQGVLLLNTALSVPAGEANGHKHLGWEKLAQQALAKTSNVPTAYVLWGKQAQRLEKHIHPGDHLILKSAHPSPLSAHRGFFGSRPFSAINTWLVACGTVPINWAG
ncbi:uracil-DNA glycosylase [Pseudophaeobacter flagellatus]|uniref:uracil-DNA glycosylase n=1 Tax=Pseudophaeobacter flagellatus TaxID=2899119 RepID=UPI001E31EFC9|nr:uracil-DNA glycosylase [Pseudophaeobacter flagellatus]MCD9147761.1 uracil-DNA glycosylase [Pseudophaeobacter flagellatus]